MNMPYDALTEATDEALLVLYANGDPVAARELARRLVPRCLGFAARMLGDGAEAEDVAQEAMLRLWRIAPDWRPGEAQVATWLYRVVANLCTDRLRRRRPVDLDAVPEPEDGAPGPLSAMLDAHRAEALQAALDRLPERQRQAVVLRHLEGMGNPDIGAIMGIGTEAVESLVARGKRALAGMLRHRRRDLGYGDD
ncbi:RNA polymerase sigma factor [Halodurantibacterium flavum]|uniref:RNA polymerase sigma factor n=1 Tax=Halodurantibacterium flavum TaxID=1382802 RepID=A0ABW4S2F4_9RHOB